METLDTIKVLLDLGLTAALVYALIAGSRRVWVFGHVHRDSLDQFTQRLSERDTQLADEREQHHRELADRDRLIAQIRADCDRERAEWVSVRDRLIEMALRSTTAGEKVAATAERIVGGS